MEDASMSSVAGKENVLELVLSSLFPRNLCVVGLCNTGLLGSAQASAVRALARFFPEAVVADSRSALFELLWRWEYKYTCTTAALNQADKAAIRAIVASLGLAEEFASSECHGAGDDEKFFAHFVPSLRMDWGETDTTAVSAARAYRGSQTSPSL